MADIGVIGPLRGKIARGEATPEDISKFFAAGGSPDELVRLVASGSLSQQLQQAQRSQGEQLGLRNALLTTGGQGQGGIQALLNRPTGFDAFGSQPQEIEQSPFAGLDLSEFTSGGAQIPQPLPQPDIPTTGTFGTTPVEVPGGMGTQDLSENLRDFLQAIGKGGGPV